MVLIGTGYAGYYFGSREGAVAIARAEARIAQYEKELADLRAASVEQSREIERQWQAAFDANARRLTDEKASIAASLELALNSLRSRAMRTIDSSGSPGAHCKGATGAELSREDAEFLIREATRADKIRAGLMACYDSIDALKPKK